MIKLKEKDVERQAQIEICIENVLFVKMESLKREIRGRLRDENRAP